jgi:hypothetical protein
MSEQSERGSITQHIGDSVRGSWHFIQLHNDVSAAVTFTNLGLNRTTI